MEIKGIGSQPSMQGTAEWFTGTVRVDPLLLQANDPSRVTGASVTFEPRARTAWHSHPLVQTLTVTAGCGRVQREGRPVEETRLGVSFGFHRKKSTGTAPHQRYARRILPSRKNSTAAAPPGLGM